VQKGGAEDVRALKWGRGGWSEAGVQRCARQRAEGVESDTGLASSSPLPSMS
jgi:hypothetical protein